MGGRLLHLLLLPDHSYCNWFSDEKRPHGASGARVVESGPVFLAYQNCSIAEHGRGFAITLENAWAFAVREALGDGWIHWTKIRGPIGDLSTMAFHLGWELREN